MCSHRIPAAPLITNVRPSSSTPPARSTRSPSAAAIAERCTCERTSDEHVAAVGDRAQRGVLPARPRPDRRGAGCGTSRQVGRTPRARRRPPRTRATVLRVLAGHGEPVSEGVEGAGVGVSGSRSVRAILVLAPGLQRAHRHPHAARCARGPRSVTESGRRAQGARDSRSPSLCSRSRHLCRGPKTTTLSGQANGLDTSTLRLDRSPLPGASEW